MQKRISIFADKCVGCRACEVVCSLCKTKTCNPKISRIHVMKNEIEGIDRPFVCQQCVRPPCIDACPVNAISIDSTTGAIIRSDDLCTGCRLCIDSCPCGAIRVDPITKMPIVCDLCGGKPQCVEICQTNAIVYAEPNVLPKAKMAATLLKLVKSERV